MGEIGFIVGCFAISAFFFLLANVARKSARKLRGKNLSTLDKFQLKPHHLFDLKSRQLFTAKNRQNLSLTHPDYSAIKENISEYLLENNVYKAMELCVFILVKSKLTTKLGCCPIANLKRKELNNLMRNMRNGFSHKNQYLVNQAVLFEFRERTMLTPFSLIGSRVFQFLVDVWKHAEEDTEDTNNCFTNAKEKLIKVLESTHNSTGKCWACNSGYRWSRIRREVRLIILAGGTVILPIAVWLGDNITDVVFFIHYAQYVGDPILQGPSNHASRTHCRS